MSTLQTIIDAATAAGAQGIWLLSDAAVDIQYDVRPADDEALRWPRTLDLLDAGRVLVIRLGEADNTAPAGLTTLQPAPGYCRACGCSQLNACETDDGPCSWVEEDLCTRCAAEGSGS